MRPFVTIYFLIASIACLNAQTVVQIAEKEARTHLIRRVNPEYPPIAEAAHIEGSVFLQIEIDTQGRVMNVKYLSGPLMLRQVAIDAVQEWKYTPFQQDGKPVTASTVVSVPFLFNGAVTSRDHQVSLDLFPLAQKCRKLVKQKIDPDAAVKACKKAKTAAEKFSPGTHFNVRRTAYIYYATALILDNKAKEAIDPGQQAVAIVQQRNDNNSGASGAYAILAQAQALSGDLVSADQNLTVAEGFERKALDSSTEHEWKTQFTQTLKNLLNFHANVLNALGKKQDAQAKLGEAAKL